jgi:Uma2 family endonuclease
MKQPSIPVRRPATYQDYLDAPEEKFAQLIGGALYLPSRPSTHQWAVTQLGVRLFRHFCKDRKGPEGWLICHGPELHFEGDVLVPDHVGWRNARLPKPMPEEWIDLKVVPDWVCEVLTAETRALDLTLKRDRCRDMGIPFLWHIDPDARLLEAFALEDGCWRLVAALADDAEVRLPPFEAIGFSSAELWP